MNVSFGVDLSTIDTDWQAAIVFTRVINTLMHDRSQLLGLDTVQSTALLGQDHFLGVWG
jgi:hypothetical protein